jgi:NhaC family Na+:H+ antiporter
MKKISKIWSIFNIILLIFLIIIALIFNLSLYLAIFSTAMYSFFVLMIHHYPLRPIINKVYSNVKLVSKVILLLSLIGILIPLLFQIGAMPNFIYYAIGIISKMNVLLFAFILAIILSMLIGTSLGTLTILAPLFMGIASSINLPGPMIVGALVSGSYFGDRASPLSSAVHLTASVTQTDVRANIRLLLNGSIFPLVLSIILYYALGRHYVLTSTLGIEAIKSGILASYAIHWMYLMPFVALILLILFKIPIIRSIAFVYALSLIIYCVQGFDLNTFLSFTFNGYVSKNIELSNILKSSGFGSMISLFLVILASAMLNSFLEIGRMLDSLIEPYLKNIKDFSHLTRKAALLSVILSLITCNQTLTSIITGNYMNTYYDRNNVNRSQLARIIGDTGLNVVGLIPWNVNGLLIATITGIPTLNYAPYAFFTITLAISSIFILPKFGNK